MTSAAAMAVLLVKFGLMWLHSTAPKQSPNSQFLPSLLVKMGLPGPERLALPAQPKWQQSQSLLIKLGFLGLRSSVPRQLSQLQTQQLQRLLMKLGLLRLRSSVPAEMALKDHVLGCSEMASKDHMSEPAEDGTKGSRVGVQPKWQQVQNMLLKLGLLGVQRTGYDSRVSRLSSRS